MPQGYYGKVEFDGFTYLKGFWSSLKSEALRWAKVSRKSGFHARVIRGTITLGTLAGGAKDDTVWFVATRKKDFLRIRKPRRK